MPEARETQTAMTATAVTAFWTKTPTSTATSTATSTPTPSATPTLTHTSTITPNYLQTEAEAIRNAEKATETMAVIKSEKLLEQALSVCQGKVLADAPEWHQSLGEVNSSVICTKNACETLGDYFLDKRLDSLDPKDVSELHLVICEERKMTVLQTCYYYPGHIAVDRVQEKAIFTIFAAQSGKTVGHFSLIGGMPQYCPQSTLLNPTFPLIFRGEEPEIAAIFQKLNSYMHLPAQ
jgi:hypothetical protein